MTNKNLITWDRFAAIHMTVSGYAVGIFLKRDDGKYKTIELINITESGRVSTLGVCKILEEYSKVEYISRQEIIQKWVPFRGDDGRTDEKLVDKVSEEFGSGTQILLNPECDKMLAQLQPIVQNRVGMVDLGISINDNLLIFAPSLEKEVRRKISDVTSEVEIETNPYISVLLMGVGYLNRQSAFNTRNITSFGGDVRTRLRTDDDPEYVRDNERRDTGYAHSPRVYSNPNASYFNGEMGRLMGRRF
jgi:hypothetical protein